MSRPSSQVYTVLIHAAIIGVIGFMDHTSTVYREYKNDFEMLIEDTRKALLSFYDLMHTVIAECDQSFAVLTHIKSELLIANEGQMFDRMDLEQAKKRCQRLLVAFVKTLRANAEATIRASKALIKIRFMKENFKKTRSKDRMTYTAIGATAGVFFGSGLGAVVGAGFTLLANFCSSYDEKAISHILHKLEIDLITLCRQSTESTDLIRDNLEDISKCVESAKKNITYNSQLGSRVVVQTQKMINEIDILFTKLNDLKLMAAYNAFYNCKILVLENPNDLYLK